MNIRVADFYKGKKVFITGHTGFKGSWMCLLLNMWGAEVYGYALNPPTEPALFSDAKIDQLVHSTIADIRDFQFLSDEIQKIQPDIVIHMAAQPLVRESYINPIETYEINVMGTVNLLEACRKVSSAVQPFLYFLIMSSILPSSLPSILPSINAAEKKGKRAEEFIATSWWLLVIVSVICTIIIYSFSSIILI
jgi:nucleoside-diphosphate-sugar epimerase